jgi:adenosine/AMP kinase
MDNVNIINIKKDNETQIIIGHAGFIKTIEDLYEAMASSSPGIKFGIAFNEASGVRLVRSEGNDDSLKKLAEDNAVAIACGHIFVILFKGAYPINVVNSLKNVSEVVTLHCATANDVQVLTFKTEKGNAIIGIVDGEIPKGIESKQDKITRKKLLRDIGYKL